MYNTPSGGLGGGTIATVTGTGAGAVATVLPKTGGNWLIDVAIAVAVGLIVWGTLYVKAGPADDAQ